ARGTTRSTMTQPSRARASAIRLPVVSADRRSMGMRRGNAFRREGSRRLRAPNGDASRHAHRSAEDGQSPAPPANRRDIVRRLFATALLAALAFAAITLLALE